jgi:hypothetical protein
MDRMSDYRQGSLLQVDANRNLFLEYISGDSRYLVYYWVPREPGAGLLPFKEGLILDDQARQAVCSSLGNSSSSLLVLRDSECLLYRVSPNLSLHAPKATLF